MLGREAVSQHVVQSNEKLYRAPQRASCNGSAALQRFWSSLLAVCERGPGIQLVARRICLAKSLQSLGHLPTGQHTGTLSRDRVTILGSLPMKSTKERSGVSEAARKLDARFNASSKTGYDTRTGPIFVDLVALNQKTRLNTN